MKIMQWLLKNHDKLEKLVSWIMERKIVEDYLPYQVINNWKSVEVKSIYPTDDEAMKALNILTWYCVWKWMKPWDYKDSEDLCMNMTPWVELLRAKAFNSNL